MRTLIIFVLLFLSQYSFGQNVADSLLITFYQKTLFSVFSDELEEKDKSEILVQTDFSKHLSNQKSKLNQFIFFDNTTSYYSVLEKPFKQNSGKIIYHICHRVLSEDTIDVDIRTTQIVSMSRKKITLATDFCDSVEGGYIPSARFIFDGRTSKWNFLTRNQIRKEINSIKKY
ncbi:hypothetical protein [Bernardetia sp.]|uniref:hypothetical protein n=1 Tax=Bernardetia sp. TaxID=1937974 RepID=UPI0025C4A863|nr:hypothetical protein [Bernardetia sp.]